MKITGALAVAATLLLSGAAQAVPLLAGWDYSQYTTQLNITGTTGRQTTLKSNYSDLDDVQYKGLGVGSDYGTQYVNGQFGSYATPASGVLPLRVAGGNIDLNLQGSNGPGGSTLLLGDASSGNALLNFEVPASQQSFNAVRFTAGTMPAGFSTVDVVFGVDLGALTADGISLSLAGRTNSSTSSVNVQFSTDGSTYGNVGTFNLSSSADVFSIAPIATGPISELFFRLQFVGDNTKLPSIDNVQIRANTVVVPEPGTMALLMTGLAGLAALGRRRA